MAEEIVVVLEDAPVEIDVVVSEIGMVGPAGKATPEFLEGVASANQSRTLAEQAKTAAESAKESALQALSDAQTAASIADQLRAAAAEAALASGASSEEASVSAQAANAAKTAADEALASAITARDAAVVAREGAETARAGVEENQQLTDLSRLAAEEARSDAQTAKTGSEDARSGAIQASSDAQSAKSGAEAARDASVVAKNAAESAKTAAESAKTAAESTLSSAVTKPYLFSRGDQLIPNGSGILGNNTEFSTLTFANNIDLPAGASGAFVSPKGVSNAWYNDTLIPVDPNKAYRFSYALKQLQSASADGSAHYGWFQAYDVDGLAIGPSSVMFHPGTTTALAAALKPGDTTALLADASGWAAPNASPPGNTHQRGFIFWNYVNAKGYAYAPETYSRNFYLNLFDIGGVNLATGVVTLKTPWAGPSIPAGTKLSASNSAGTFKYISAQNALASKTSWTTFWGEVGGVDTTSGRWEATRFPPGTASVKIGWLLNRLLVGGNVDVNSQHAIANVALTPVPTPLFEQYRTVSGTVTVSMNPHAGVQRLMLTGPTSFYTASGYSLPPGTEVLLFVKQDATGGRSFTWSSTSFLFNGGLRPIVTPTPGAVDCYRLTGMDDGNVMVEVVAQDLGGFLGVGANEPREFYGSGSPEGVLASSTGSSYVDRNGTNGAVRWRKWIGTGSTGWKVVEGDTGPRILPAEAGWTPVAGGNFGPIIHRHNNVVDLMLYLSTTDFANASGNPIIIPSGFRPRRRRLVLGARADTGAARYFDMTTVGGLAIPLGTGSASIMLSVSYLTDDAWPSVLPGTPG